MQAVSPLNEPGSQSNADVRNSFAEISADVALTRTSWHPSRPFVSEAILVGYVRWNDSVCLLVRTDVRPTRPP